MKQCWSEGELRSYLDGELPPEEIGRVAAHLAECGACMMIVEGLAARAERVSALLGDLSGAGLPACLPVARSRRRWIPAAAALAACLALAFVLLPKRATPPVIPSAVEPSPPAPIAAVSVPAVAHASWTARPRKRAQPRKPEIEYFLALDDDPFEMGVVRRVALGPAEVPADVVFSPDGRARAIRLVNYTGN
jgi:anti-sigma factor RsiW